ncbi:MAG: hypothetical protein IKG42_03660 [Clostridia bacterium]|nr:hypothetical protein [Clostridia bacterium]
MKSNKAIKNLTILAVIILILILAFISFIGIPKNKLKDWEKPDYSFSKEIEGKGVSSITFYVDDSTKEIEEVVKSEDKEETEENKSDESVEDTVSVNETVSTDENSTEVADTTNEEKSSEDEEPETTTVKKTVPVNGDGVLNKDNYKKTKSIIQERLKEYGITDYSIRLNEDNGNLNLEIPYDHDDIDNVVKLVTSYGSVEIIDTDTNEVLLDNSDIKNAKAYYQPSQSVDDGFDFYLQFEFNNDGLKKYRDITKQYVETIDSEGESKIKSITIKIDDEDKYVTYFAADGNYTYLGFPLYQGVTDEETLTKNNEDTVMTQYIINSGKLPIVYTINSDSVYYMETSNVFNIVKVSVIILIVAVAIVAIFMILKNKKLGIFSLLLEIGYIAILLIIIRNSNDIILTITGLISILGATLINYYFLACMMKHTENRFLVTLKDMVLRIIPLLLFTIVFIYSNVLYLESIGKVLVWGMLISLVYNATLSNLLFYLCDKETIEGAEK